MYRAVLYAINESGGFVLQSLLERQVKIDLLISRQSTAESDRLPYNIAKRAGIPYEFLAVDDNRIVQRIRELKPDFIISGWYHLKIPHAVFGTATLVAVNIHPSLLPAYRGATPVQWCIINGEKETGLSLHVLEDRFDTGQILWQQKLPIDPDETAGELHRRLESLVPLALDNLLARARAGNFTGTPQDPAKASWYPKRSEKDAPLHWELSAQTIHNRIRGLNPWPLASFSASGRTHKVAQSRLVDKEACPLPGGTVSSVADHRTAAQVVCGDGKTIELLGIAPCLENTTCLLS